MDRKTRVIETVRDRKGELFLGALALGGVGLGVAAASRGDEADDADESEASPDDAPASDETP